MNTHSTFFTRIGGRSLFFKVVAPQLMMAGLLAVALIYVLQEFARETNALHQIFYKIHTASQLSSRMRKLVNDKKLYLISYRFARNKTYPRLIREVDKEIHELIQHFETLNSSYRGRELLRTYLISRTGIEAIQAMVISAIEEGVESKISRLFNVWTLQKQINEAAIADLDIFNVKKLRDAGMEIQSTNRNFKRVLAALIASMFILVIGSIAVLYRYFINPLVKITEVADAISTGNFKARISTHNNVQEIEVLALSLNRMADSLVDVQMQLNANVKELSRSNTELEQFAYIASHDLKEPLRTVSSYLTLIQRRFGSNLNAQGNEFINFAISGAKRMTKLVESLLEYSRIGHSKKNLTWISCNGILDLVLANMKLTCEETGAVIERGDLPMVFADSSELFQLFQNLISNAIKFRSETPPHIFISAHNDASRIVINVKDNGIGLDPENSAQIFQIFGRLHSEAEYSGAGIGLAICKKIIESYGGSIWVESETGAGATFHFTIPSSDWGANNPVPIFKKDPTA